MKLIVGLGNPGKNYAQTRHNIGFMAIDRVAGDYFATTPKQKFHGLCSEAMIGGQKCLLLKPQTFMNRSGQSVRAAVEFYSIALDHMLVLHDELDVLPGRIKVKCGGGAAGHNGLKDIDRHVGPDYWRGRLGIGHPGHADQVTNYVLGRFAASEMSAVDHMLEGITKGVSHFAEKGGYAMREFLHQPEWQEYNQV